MLEMGPFGAAHPYKAYIWEYPPPPPGGTKVDEPGNEFDDMESELQSSVDYSNNMSSVGSEDDESSEYS